MSDIVCKYCFENSISCPNIQLITPCKCTNPVCIKCLQQRIIHNKKMKCEICTEPFILPNNSGIIVPESFDENDNLLDESTIQTGILIFSKKYTKCVTFAIIIIFLCIFVITGEMLRSHYDF